mmetsp:Transcript_33170/g.72322  ORF Transcript_33170/g.72322 Transcript_33170/m.72322 type:complete len:532 (+) Transcript_33170:81-1676(+)
MVSQGIGGHEGYSGTPIWRFQGQAAKIREEMLQESLKYAAEKKRPIISPNVLAEAVCLGDTSGKQVVRHVLVKCLRRVADRLKVQLPSAGLFQPPAPIALFALFDGQSGANSAGPGAAEFCARNFHSKVLDNLASLPPDCTGEAFVKAALVKSFEDLDRELLESMPDSKDGCGASVALLLGEHLFTAVLGACDAVLCEAADGNGMAQPRSLGRGQGRCHLPEERARLLRAGAIVQGEGNSSRVVGPGGVTTTVSRSLGDAAWKAHPRELLSCVPEVQSVRLSWAEKHQFVLLVARPVAEALTARELLDAALTFPAQPRATCGEIATLALEKNPDPAAQCTAVEVWFLPGGPVGPRAADLDVDGVAAAAKSVADAPPPKRPRTVDTLAPKGEMQSARLRHIMVRFVDNGSGQKPAPETGPGRKVTRTRQEAEALLRGFMRALREEARKPGAPKKPEEMALKSTVFANLCKTHSECATAQKGGGMCGDLGWVTREAQRRRGGSFQDAVAVLKPGDYSDIATSNEGLHLIQRIA